MAMNISRMMHRENFYFSTHPFMMGMIHTTRTHAFGTVGRERFTISQHALSNFVLWTFMVFLVLLLWDQLAWKV
jgi:hypothetical protein